jgi:AraC-like DNA-binding protein
MNQPLSSGSWETGNGIVAAIRHVPTKRTPNVAVQAARGSALRRFEPPPADLAPVIMTVTWQEEALRSDSDWTRQIIDGRERLGTAFHYRARIAKRFGAGQAEFCAISDKFWVLVSDYLLDEPYAYHALAPEMLRVRIAIDGDGEYVSSDGEVFDLRGPSALLVVEPADAPPADVVLAGLVRSVYVYIHRDVLGQIYADGEGGLPELLQAFIAGDLRQRVTRRITIGSGLMKCGEELRTCELEGRSRRLFIQAKALEILCYAIDALANDEGFGSSEASKVTTRSVLRAQQLLAESFAAPPSLDALAHAVGLSRSSLCVGFRRIVGQTVFDYIADLRMQHALELLKDRETSITQIAHEVGFSQTSAFTIAVQRRFGTTPTELRRRSLPSG